MDLILIRVNARVCTKCNECFNPCFNGSNTYTRNIPVGVFSIVNKLYINSKSINKYLNLI